MTNKERTGCQALEFVKDLAVCFFDQKSRAFGGENLCIILDGILLTAVCGNANIS